MGTQFPDITQLAEFPTFNRRVPGSIPGIWTIRSSNPKADDGNRLENGRGSNTLAGLIPAYSALLERLSSTARGGRLLIG